MLLRGEVAKLRSPDFAVPNRKPSGPAVLSDSVFAKRLVAGYLIGGETETLRDVTGRYDAAYNGGANKPVMAAGPVGRHLDFSAATNNSSRYNIDSAAVRDVFNGSTPFTILFHARSDDTASNRPAFSINGTDDFLIYLSDQSERTFRVFWRDVTTSLSYSRSGDFGYLQWQVFAYTFDGVDQHKLFINGQQVASATASGSAAGPYSSGPAIGGWEGSSLQYFKDELASVFIFNADFSGQVRALSSDVYGSILDPAIPQSYFIPSAGGSTDTLLADDVESASETTGPAIGQEHGLTANDTQSTSETSSPAVGQEHGLLADDAQSTSEVSAPAIQQVVPLSANDTESASETTSPAIGQVHALSATFVESASETELPVVGQIHVLAANDAQSTSELTSPAIAEVNNVHVLYADDTQSTSELTLPGLGQIHALAANDIQGLSQVTTPALGIVGAQQPGNYTLMRRRGRR